MDMSETTRMTGLLRGALRENEPMAKHVSWRAGGSARLFFQPADVADLRAFLKALDPRTSVLFVGLGSNLLVRDGGFGGAVVLTHRAFGDRPLILVSGDPAGASQPRTSGLSPIACAAGASIPAPHVARFVAKHGGGGAEWLAGVPGTMGGALAMNAGCYGGETWNHVTEVETIDREGNLHRRSPREYEIGYRHVRLSINAEEWFLGARLEFPSGDTAAAMARIRELLARRVATQPLNQPNAGSVFRNPEGDHAARLIESCGLKGFAIGGAQVSPKHANFIVNTGAATAADIEALVDHVQATVEARTGVGLVREVRIVGEARHG
jgi:UDP-N-acetylmuramate dehydrogenase